jgi:hypothetical protein
MRRVALDWRSKGDMKATPWGKEGFWIKERVG